MQSEIITVLQADFIVLTCKDTSENLSVLGYRQLFLIDAFLSSTTFCDR